MSFRRRLDALMEAWAPAGMGKGGGALAAPPGNVKRIFFCLAYVASLQESGRYSIKPKLSI